MDTPWGVTIRSVCIRRGKESGWGGCIDRRPGISCANPQPERRLHFVSDLSVLIALVLLGVGKRFVPHPANPPVECDRPFILLLFSFFFHFFPWEV